MQEDAKQTEAPSAEIEEVMRNLVSAIRSVKLYPPNNPIYSQSVRKSFESLSRYLDTAPRYFVGVQKTYFLFEQTPVAKETQLNKTIAQDLFGKGVREMVFLPGLTEQELVGFYSVLALSPEEQALKSGIVSMLWELGADHIRVTEASLEDVIKDQPDRGKQGDERKIPRIQLSPEAAKMGFAVAGRTLLVGDLIDNPERFGATMIDIAQRTKGENESVEDRLYTLYQEAGRLLRERHPEQGSALFQGLARSVLAMEQSHRDKFIMAKLYAERDADQLREQSGEEAPGEPGPDGPYDTVPEDLHEVVTGRFSQQWTVPQIAELLKQSAAKPVKPAPAAPASVTVDPSQIEAVPIAEDMYALARELAEYSPDELETLKTISEVGREADIIEAAVRTLIFLLPQVKLPGQAAPSEKMISYFSSIVRQLEETLAFLLDSRDYDLASIIVRAYHLPVDPAFRPRLLDATRKASSREVTGKVVSDMRKNPKGSPVYQAAYAFLSVLDREATTTLLEILAVEKDRAIRRFLIDILKDLAKDQVAMIGQRLSDGRWFVVRNIVCILSESRSEEAVTWLEKVVDHKQVQIRHEVIKALINIGGKRAAALLPRFLGDKDIDVQLAAVHALAVIPGAGGSEAKALLDVLNGRPVRKKENELTIEVIKTLEKIGDREAAEFLGRYARIRWWKPRKPQLELRDVAVAAIETIGRRLGNGS